MPVIICQKLSNTLKLTPNPLQTPNSNSRLQISNSTELQTANAKLLTQTTLTLTHLHAVSKVCKLAFIACEIILRFCLTSF